MKKLPVLITFLAIIFSTLNAESQALSETAKKKVTVGVDVFADIWLYTNDPLYFPDGFSFRTINQGATGFIMYNLQFSEKGTTAFSIGLAIRSHNSYSNSVIVDIKSETIVYNLINDLPHPNRTIPLSYKRSKINLTYLDLPVEFKFRSEGGFKLGIGLKVGYLIDSKQKYVGEWPVDFNFDSEEVRYNAVNEKSKSINQLEKWSFGPTLRIGYKWVSFFAYYQVTDIFENDRGPVMNPISLGITITPF